MVFRCPVAQRQGFGNRRKTNKRDNKQKQPSQPGRKRTDRQTDKEEDGGSATVEIVFPRVLFVFAFLCM